jgi:exopolysaccharide production protein ExoQ
VFKVLEKAFVVFALLYFAGAFTIILQPDKHADDDIPPPNSSAAVLHLITKSNDVDPTEKNPLNLGLEILIYSVTAALIAKNLRSYLRLAWQVKLLWILLALAMVSALWSPVPAFTFRRSLVLIASTSFGVYVGTRYTMREILHILCITGAIAAVASCLVIVFLPDYGVATGVNAGAWQGIFGQKNPFGRFMSLEALVFVLAALEDKTWRWWYVLGALLCSGLLVMAHDMTAYLMLPILVALVPVFQYVRRHSFARLAAVLTLVGATLAGFVSLIVLSPEKILEALGKDATLSGRTDIWSMVWQKILNNPVLGHGYSAFWLGWNGKDSSDIWMALQWPVPHSHNGFLDLLADLGFVGLLLFLAGYAVCFQRALHCARASKTLLGLFPVLYFSFMIVFNFSESSILKQENIYWVLYAATWVLTVRWLALAERAAETVPASEARRAFAPATA